MKRTCCFAPVLIAAAGPLLTIQSTSACPNPFVVRTTPLLPMNLAGPEASPSSLAAHDLHESHDSIVGFWAVTYTSAGAVSDKSFVTFHSDGTDYDNDMAPPLSGDVCEGVWKPIGPRTVKRHHVGWLWDPTGTMLQGTFTLDEVITLGAGSNSYTGTFTLQPLDLNGNPLGPPTVGTTSATRITVP